MEKILKDLEKLGGIHHSCLMREEDLLASTFPEILAENLSGACRVAQQIFMAVEGMGATHKEAYIELEENLLIAYRVADETVLLILTDKDVNLALINTSVRSALPRIKRNLAGEVTEKVAPAKTEEPPAKAPVSRASEAELSGLMDQLRECLAEFIGPAASFLFDDSYENWKQTHGVSKGKIAELIKVLATEIDDKADRSKFLQTSVSIVRASAGKS